MKSSLHYPWALKQVLSAPIWHSLYKLDVKPSKFVYAAQPRHNETDWITRHLVTAQCLNQTSWMPSKALQFPIFLQLWHIHFMFFQLFQVLTWVQGTLRVSLMLCHTSAIVIFTEPFSNHSALVGWSHSQQLPEKPLRCAVAHYQQQNKCCTCNSWMRFHKKIWVSKGLVSNFSFSFNMGILMINIGFLGSPAVQKDSFRT